ncbi:hypothetical protein C8T65DRAFT_834333 [Cerioporus squamosus]|nr:hypothetical protein C8T65DRAFT_834333 [Cerioporus squamosus]
MVISGSFAIQFSDRTHYHGSDLDLYLHRDNTILEVGAWLTAEGYKYTPFRWQEATLAGELQRITEHPGYCSEDIEEPEQLYSNLHVRSVCGFVRRSVSGDVERTTQVMIARRCPMATILDFHSACVMNVITYNAAYALFPRATFEEHTALILNSKTPHARDALEKYAARGFRLIEQETAHQHPYHVAAFLMNQPRWVPDEHSWIIPLDTQGVIPPPPPSPVSEALGWDPIAECGWSLSVGTHSPHVVTRCVDIRLPLLRWRYTWPAADMESRMLEEFKGLGGRRLHPIGMAAWRMRDTSRDDMQWYDAQMRRFRLKCAAEQEQGRLPPPHQD